MTPNVPVNPNKNSNEQAENLNSETTTTELKGTELAAEETKASDPVVNTAPEPEVKAAVVVNDKTPFVPHEKNPSNWEIVVIADTDKIEAYHTITGRKFNGTIGEFSAKLRGE